MNGTYQQDDLIGSFIIELAMHERLIELKRQILCSRSSFSPFFTFVNLCKWKSSGISSEDIYQFITSLKPLEITRSECQNLIIYHDRDQDGYLSYEEFLELILPKDNNELKSSLISQTMRETTLDKDLPFDVERIILGIFEAEINLLRSVGTKKLELEMEGLYIHDILNKLARNQELSLFSIQNYFDSLGIVIYDEEIKCIFNRIGLNSKVADKQFEEFYHSIPSDERFRFHNTENVDIVKEISIDHRISVLSDSFHPINRVIAECTMSTPRLAGQIDEAILSSDKRRLSFDNLSEDSERKLKPISELTLADIPRNGLPSARYTSSEAHSNEEAQSSMHESDRYYYMRQNETMEQTVSTITEVDESITEPSIIALHKSSGDSSDEGDGYAPQNTSKLACRVDSLIKIEGGTTRRPVKERSLKEPSLSIHNSSQATFIRRDYSPSQSKLENQYSTNPDTHTRLDDEDFLMSMRHHSSSRHENHSFLVGLQQLIRKVKEIDETRKKLLGKKDFHIQKLFQLLDQESKGWVDSDDLALFVSSSISCKQRRFNFRSFISLFDHENNGYLNYTSLIRIVSPNSHPEDWRLSKSPSITSKTTNFEVD